VGRTGAGPLAFPVSLAEGEVVLALPASVGAVVPNPSLSQIAGAAVRAMSSIRRFCVVALPVRVPVPASLMQVG
jgi:hypothetical protein